MEYAPALEGLALYRILADVTPGDAAGMVGFADEYGLLTQRDAEIEHVGIWNHEILWLRQILRLWDLYRAGDANGLSDFISWNGGAAFYTMPSNEVVPLSELAGDGGPAETEGVYHVAGIGRPEGFEIECGDLMTPALLTVISFVNNLADFGIKHQLHLNAKTGRPERVTATADLRGFLNLQLLLAVVESKEPRRCLVCGKWFDVAPGTSRADRRFCSGACRATNSRRNELLAKGLHADGKSFEEIAADLDSDVETVRRWVSKRRER